MTTEPSRTTSTDATRPVPVVVPRRLGDYELGERLGEGGMGVVWRATSSNGREVAIKVLREHIAHDEHARARLRREVHTLARVHHPRIASVIDADVDGPAPYIVTEYVPGRPLDQVVADRGPIRGEALLRLGRGLGEALHAIHGAGIVHRDLKPGNVLMVGDGGDPVVIDFGIAQVADDVRLTMTGMVMGTPGYLSPEVVEGGQVSEATDWWGWAATLAYAVSGQPPFGRGPLTVVLDRVLRGRLQLEGVDPMLVPLLTAALDPDPLRRPTETQVLDGLERYARREDVTGALPVWMHGPDPDRTTVAPQRGLDRTMVAPAVQAVPTGQPGEAGRPVRAWEAGRPAQAGQSDRPAQAGQSGHPQWHGPGVSARDPSPAPFAEVGGPAGEVSPYPEGSVVPRQPGEPGGPDPRIGRSARRGTLVGLLVAFVGLATTAPLLAWGLYAVWEILTRTVDRSLTGLVLRRHVAGRRRSDVPVLVLASPWHLVVAALGSVLSLILPLGLAALVAFVVSGAVTTSEVMLPVRPDHPLAIGIGSLIGAWVGWWGLGSTSLRRGSRTVLRSVVPQGAATVAVITLCVVGGAALAVWSYLDGGAVSWWPMGPDFDPRQWLPFGL
ncbi:MAG: protein kinase [Ornithinimicrobium sp.]|uniref:serine/threonine-protein kinase n=1 Tax=Ornithinimicrobium sp. TaxID=1977084 RepID=UPI0026DEDE30|nr:serine/threonine protein kinase [Ornithinimicrobium sp.]MDO5740867.1 protein kinase [Ornithinimicrobium sp.]